MDSFIYNHLCDPGIGILLGMCSWVLPFAYCLVAFTGWRRLADRQKYLRIVGLFWVLYLVKFVFTGVIFSDACERKAREVQAAIQKQAQLDAVPRVVAEKDGCKVYAFKQQYMWHYFTVCPNASVKTDTQYQVQVGKKTETRTSEITTGKAP